jgi:hypothetical protein
VAYRIRQGCNRAALEYAAQNSEPTVLSQDFKEVDRVLLGQVLQVFLTDFTRRRNCNVPLASSSERFLCSVQ